MNKYIYEYNKLHVLVNSHIYVVLEVAVVVTVFSGSIHVWVVLADSVQSQIVRCELQRRAQLLADLSRTRQRVSVLMETKAELRNLLHLNLFTPNPASYYSAA